MRYPYMVCNVLVLVLSIVLIPLILRMLDRLFAIRAADGALFWRFVWVIPALFAAMCLMAANIFMGERMVTTIFYVGRIFISVGMVLTCFLLARLLRQEAQAAALAERSRMMENLLTLQREQYATLTENAQHDKAARHNLRHQLVVLNRYGASGDLDGLNQYLKTLTDALPTSPENEWCEHYAVRAVAAHYLSMAESAKIKLDVRLDIPAQTGQVQDMDLCIIVGNLLENAVEACRRMDTPNNYIKVRSRMQGDYLSLMVENSFDGMWNEKDGMYLSRKYSGDVPREGVGLSSVRAVCEKYGGMLRIEAGESSFRVSVLVGMHPMC